MKWPRSSLRRHRASRGVSEVVSFLLIFAILIGVSITGAVFGIESLEDASKGEEVHVAESSLGYIRSDMYDLSGGAAYRSTEVEIASTGSLQYGEPITITVDATSASGSMDPFTIRPQPIVYTVGRADLVYVSGAVLLEQPDGGVAKEGPIFRIDGEQTILPLLNTTYGDGSTGVGGSGIAYVVGYRIDESTRRYEPTDASSSPIDATVTITVETPRTMQWNLFFASDPRFENIVVDDETNTVQAQFVTKRLYIKTTNIDVRFDV